MECYTYHHVASSDFIQVYSIHIRCRHLCIRVVRKQACGPVEIA